MLKGIGRFSAGDFTKSVFTLLGGTAIAQIIPLLAAPFLTRMYSPEQFGLLALLMAVSNPLCMIVTGKYEQAIVLPKEKEDAINLTAVSFFLAFLVSGVLIVLFYFTHEYFSRIFHVPQLNKVAFVIPLLVLLVGIWQPVNYWLIRQKEYKRMAANKIIQMAAIALFSLLFGQMLLDNGLVWGYWCGWAAVAIFSVYQLFQTGFNPGVVSKNTMITVARSYKDFPLFNSFPSLLNTAALSIPVFYIIQNYSSGDAGHFNLCRQLLFIPSGFIAAAIAQVYYQRVVSHKQEVQKLTPEFLKIVKVLSIFALLMMVILILFGPVLFEVFFGAEWKTSGEYARILSVSVCTQFVVVPLTVTFSALQKIRQNSVLQLIYFFSIAALFFLKIENIVHFLVLLTILETVFYLVYFARIFVMVKQHDQKNNP